MYPTLQLKTMVDMVPKIWPADRPAHQARIYDHQHDVLAGLASVPSWVQEKLQEVEWRLRLRFSHEDGCFVVERLAPHDNCYTELAKWQNEDGSPRRIGPQDILDLTDLLRAGDMQRYRTPADFLRAKHTHAAEIRARNEAASTDRVLDVVDRMSSKQISEFVQVEQAIHTGERVVAHGNTERFLERAHTQTKKAEAEGIVLDNPVAAINPGMAPKVYHRNKRRKQ